MKIIVDAMGGDNAPQAPVMGAIQANKEYGVGITLVGRGEDILKVLEENGIRELPAGVEIAHASEVVEICDNPATAFREKKDSSLTVGLNLLKAGEGDAFVSAGSTGALLGAATLLIKRIWGIRRAALAPVVPTGNGGAVLIGIDKVVVKSHGSSKAASVCASLLQAKEAAENNLVGSIKELLSEVDLEALADEA